MRYLFYITILLSAVLCSCSKECFDKKIEGDYKGVFYRQAPNTIAMRSNVSLHFAQNKFTGLSDMPQYPAICQGSFAVNKGVLSVTNTCFFTADFDWSYIFNGNYQYQADDAHLRIWRDYPDGTKDVYLLEK
ncbi:MAG: hypothetical protein ACTHOF_16685 [Flavisolibacter sp.]